MYVKLNVNLTNDNIALDRTSAVQVRIGMDAAQAASCANGARVGRRKRMTCVMTHHQCQHVDASFI